MGQHRFSAIAGLRIVAVAEIHRVSRLAPMGESIGRAIKTIVDDKAYPDYRIAKKPTGRKKRRRQTRYF